MEILIPFGELKSLLNTFSESVGNQDTQSYIRFNECYDYTTLKYKIQIQPVINLENYSLKALAKLCANRIYAPILTSSTIKNAKDVFKSISAYPLDTVDRNERITFYTKILPVALIKNPPVTRIENGITYRILVIYNPDSYGLICIDSNNPVFEYLDVNNLIIYLDTFKNELLNLGSNSTFSPCFIPFILSNSFTFETALTTLILQYNSDVVKNHLKDNIFLPSTEIRSNLPKWEKMLEKTLSDKNLLKQYLQKKEQLFATYKQQARMHLLYQVQQNTIPDITVNRIKLTPTTAKYENVTVEYPGLLNIVFNRLDINSQFDITDIVRVLADFLEYEINCLPLNQTATGFLKPATFQLKINGINIELSVGTENTRRKINSHYINKNELSKVIQHALCLTTQTDFDNFVKSVSKQSLYIHNIIANGLPVKIEEHSYKNKEHPKLFFIRRNGKYYLDTSVFKNERIDPIKISRFVTFCDRIRILNNKVQYYKIWENGRYIMTDHKWARQRLYELLLEFVDAQDRNKISKIWDCFVNLVIEEQKLAEQKSQKLLDSIVKDLNIKKTTWNHKNGYVVTGKLATYFVDATEPNPTYKVYDMNTQEMICIVDKGDLGAGKDRLVTRLLMLSNDEFTASKISTLQKYLSAKNS